VIGLDRCGSVRGCLIPLSYVELISNVYVNFFPVVRVV